jgi:hypothetical protein
MKANKITLVKTALITSFMMASLTAAAQSGNTSKIRETKAVTTSVCIDTLSVTTFFTTTKALPNVSKSASVRGYRKKLRRQKDLYLIPWELRKKHLRVC